MKFSVCLPATRQASVGATVRSIRAQTVSDWELLVVGQGEDQGIKASVERAAENDSRIRYLHIDRRGSSRARTAAIRVANGELIAMTDDDCVARPDWLAILAQPFTDDPDTALVGGAMVAPPCAGAWPASCPEWVPAEAVYDPRASHRNAPPGFDWIGANFAMRRSAARLVGDFDQYLGAGGEFPAAGDTDYKLRMEAIGLRMRSTPRAVVDHTYGWRYGLQAVLCHQRDHARGNGALAAKLSLRGDPRGRHLLAITIAECLSRWAWIGRPHRIIADLRVLRYFIVAYRQCLRNYGVDENGMLFPRRPLPAGKVIPVAEALAVRAPT
jgi:glycosyltransferase involved in cell wall biosynthesis